MNLDHLPEITEKESGWGYLQPTDGVLKIFKDLGNMRKIKPIKRIVEIGFHAGHSTTYFLETFKDAKMISYGLSSVAGPNGVRMCKHYPGRLQVSIQDSRNLNPLNHANVDLTYVDGSHKWANVCNDVMLAVAWGSRYIMVDNCEQTGVKYISDVILGSPIKTWQYEATWAGRTTTNVMNLYEARHNRFRAAQVVE